MRSPVSIGDDLWWEGFVEQVAYDFNLVEESEWWMDGESDDEGADETRWVEWEEREEEWLGRGWWKEVAYRYEVYTKDRVMLTGMSDLWF